MNENRLYRRFTAAPSAQLRDRLRFQRLAGDARSPAGLKERLDLGQIVASTDDRLGALREPAPAAPGRPPAASTVVAIAARESYPCNRSRDAGFSAPSSANGTERPNGPAVTGRQRASRDHPLTCAHCSADQAASDRARVQKRMVAMTDYMQLPAEIADLVGSARLPQSYERAKQALAECDRIDECKDWGDKAAALASYARQADDPVLEKYARRIRLRAYRQLGELLREIKPSKGGRPSKTCADVPASSRSQAARDAGLSRDQQVTALRIAAIDEDEFEAAVESPQPPGTTSTGIRERHHAIRDESFMGRRSGQCPCTPRQARLNGGVNPRRYQAGSGIFHGGRWQAWWHPDYRRN